MKLDDMQLAIERFEENESRVQDFTNDNDQGYYTTNTTPAKQVMTLPRLIQWLEQYGLAVGKATLAELASDLAYPEGRLGYVTNDPTASNNGLYRKVGATGTGSWVKSAYDPVAVAEQLTLKVQDALGSVTSGMLFPHRAGEYPNWFTAEKAKPITGVPLDRNVNFTVEIIDNGQSIVFSTKRLMLPRILVNFKTAPSVIVYVRGGVYPGETVLPTDYFNIGLQWYDQNGVNLSQTSAKWLRVSDLSAGNTLQYQFQLQDGLIIGTSYSAPVNAAYCTPYVSFSTDAKVFISHLYVQDAKFYDLLGSATTSLTAYTDNKVLTEQNARTAADNTLTTGLSNLNTNLTTETTNRLADLDINQQIAIRKSDSIPIDSTTLYNPFVDDDGKILAGFDLNGLFSAQFQLGDPMPYSSFGTVQAGAFADADGFEFLSIDENGGLTFRSPFIFWLPFNNFADTSIVVLVDADYSILASLTKNGLIIPEKEEPETGTSAVFDISGDVVSATTSSGRTTILNSPWPLHGLASNGDSGFQTAQDRPMLGSSRPVWGSKTGNVLIPGDGNILMGIPVVGQSLGTGLTGVPPISITSDYPKNGLMLISAHSARTDVRLGLDPRPNAVDTLLDSDLTGFEPIVARVSSYQSTYGQTVCESMTQKILKTCNDATGRMPKLHMFASAVGGAAYNTLKKGTVPYANTLTAITAAKRLAADRGWKYWVPGICLLHGEADAANANYYNYLIDWQANYDADIRAITGQQATVKFYIGQSSSFLPGQTSACTAVWQIAQDHPDKFTLSHPNYPLEMSPDAIHLSATGYFHDGEYFARSFMAEQFNVAAWGGVKPTTFTRENGVIDIKYNAPSGNLVFDTVTVSNPGNYGFTYKDDTNSASIVSVGLMSGNTVRVTLNKTPTGSNPKILYGMTGNTVYPRVVGQGPRGNLRDNTTDISIYDSRVLYNWCVHHTINV